MGFLSKILGVSESKPKLTSPQLEPEAKKFQGELFPRIENALAGAGLTPDIDTESRRDQLKVATEEFRGNRRFLASAANRFVPRADVKVRSFLRDQINRQFSRTKESIKRGFESRGFEDKALGQRMAFGAVSGERKVATDILNAFNESVLRRSMSPSFGTELAGGLGGAAGIALAGGFGNNSGFKPSNVNPNIAVSGSPGVTSSLAGRPATGSIGFFQQFGR